MFAFVKTANFEGKRTRALGPRSTGIDPKAGSTYDAPMRVIALKRLREHWEAPGRDDSEQPLKAWYAVTKEASWRHFPDVKAQFGSASAVGQRVVFNIAGNKYRLVAYINYAFYTVYVRFIGTHAEYDGLDIEDV